MLGHRSGSIGFPLRLLARENYEKIVRLKGARHVALITGEEKIVPPGARYFVCTTESMPLDRPVAFLAVDEVQLAADWERGHVFTQRILEARGLEETMFLGAETAKPLIRRLVPEIEFVARPRFSTLTYAGPKKLTRLPRRAAVVAFSAAEVYAIAEVVRRQRGGTAVVMGALSPRARNAQVGMYQAGEVDYLVATDAIGMGLNMDLDHVSFAGLAKFDGRGQRRLGAAELAQIAGRAGRHMSDGSFGTTAEVGPLEQELVERIEDHRFDPVTHLLWRNDALSFRSVAALIQSLEQRPSLSFLIRKRDADDQLALQALARDEAVIARAGSPDRVRLLWEVCQVPDFRRTMAEGHTRLLAQIFHYLSEPEGRLPADWVARQVDRLDRGDGDIDTLTQRISHIRTWSYVAHRADWLAEALHWQERTRAIEDKLSDALHDRLTQRFVDRRAAVLVKALSDPAELMASVRSDGEVLVEGHPVGHLEGFHFVPDGEASAESARHLLAAARRVLPAEIQRRIERLIAAPDADLALDENGRIRWQGAVVAKLAAGRSALAPTVEPLANEFVHLASRERMAKRLSAWLDRELDRRLAPLLELTRAELNGAARGLAFMLAESLGCIRRSEAAPQVAALAKSERKELARLGVRLGAHAIYLAALFKPGALRLKALLWGVRNGLAPSSLPKPQPAMWPRAAILPDGYYHAIGHLPLGNFVLRVDRAEAVAAKAERMAAKGPFAATAELVRLAGCLPGEIAAVLVALGYRAGVGEDGVSFRVEHRHRRLARRPGAKRDSPFAKLEVLARRR
ncbi:MAG: disulfide oxidoreductase [Proteobacteria bacterium]|nr:disulfide oxidoreductase [Pseudomonadota bacterium]MBI3495697.1 disulfide oxidoreductase [Pseudomonadota bacterium]